MKIAKFAPVFGIIVVLVFGGMTFGQNDAEKPAAPAGPVISEGGGTVAEGAPKPAPKPASEGGETGEKVGENKTEEGKEEKKETEQEQKKPGGGGLFGNSYVFPIMIGGFVLLWIFMGRSKKKQAAKRRELLTALKKGDRVMTIGGIIGTVAEAREQELVVKVDDGTRMKFARWAIRNAGEEVSEEKQKDEQEK